MKRRGFFKALGSIALGVALATPFDILTNKQKEKFTSQIVVTGRDASGWITDEVYEIELPYTEKQLQSRLFGNSGLERVLRIDIENPRRTIRLF